MTANALRPTVLGLVVLALFATGVAHAAGPVNKTLLGTAVDGYDVVAYFTEGRPIEGVRAFQHEWNGATWRFANQEHRDLFAANPEHYAPQYGGYCAYAVSQGSTANIDPHAWAIHDGRLYLNYDAKIQELWSQDVPGYIRLADEKWPTLSDR